MCNETIITNSYHDQLDFVTIEDAQRIIVELIEFLMENDVYVSIVGELQRDSIAIYFSSDKQLNAQRVKKKDDKARP